VLKRVLVNLHSLIKASLMAVEAINRSDFFGLCKPLIVKINIVVKTVRKSSEDPVVLTQAMAAIRQEIYIDHNACTHPC
jgi:hypothetical protein